jgi:hypothetical protein
VARLDLGVVTGLAPAATDLVRLADVADQARDYAAASKADNTVRAHRRCWADFMAWCERHKLGALPRAAAEATEN